MNRVANLFLRILCIFTLVFAFNISSAFEIKGDLMIVHPSRTWDPLQVAKKGILDSIAAAKLGKNNIYLLRHSDQSVFVNYPKNVDSYYIPKEHDIIELNSEDGEHNIITQTKDLTFVGGYLEYCLANAIAFSIKDNHKPITANIYLPGVFTHKKKGVYIQPLDHDFDLSSIWPYPVNPGFIHLERQVGRIIECPDKNFIHNYMFSYGGDHPRLGNGPTPENFEYTYSCNGKNSSRHKIGRGGPQLVHINFITEPIRTK